MMQATDYIILDRPDHTGWLDVEKLFELMYKSMYRMGLMLQLCEDGTEKWIKTAKNTSGKFGLVVLARKDGEATGFAHGMIKFLPDYLGGYTVGSITHVYVADEARRSGLGKGLVKKLEEWFRHKKVHSIELQVISGNPEAIKFWENLGYKEELLQYRKF